MGKMGKTKVAYMNARWSVEKGPIEAAIFLERAFFRLAKHALKDTEFANLVKFSISKMWDVQDWIVQIVLDTTYQNLT